MSQSGNNSAQPRTIALQEFEECSFELPIAALDQTDTFSLSQAYRQAAAASIDLCREVYIFLAELCAIHLNPAERGNVWIASASSGDRRTVIPSDLRGAQSDVIEALLPNIQHAALRARLADIVWSNDLRKGATAKIALDAYCECIEGLVSGRFVPQHHAPGVNLMDAQRLIQRALQIAFATSKRGKLSDRVKAAVSVLYDEAFRTKWHVAFARTAQLAVDYNIYDAKRVAADAEAVAGILADYPEAVRIVWDYASILHRRLGDTEAQQRCELGAVRQLLRMRDECGQAGAKASWVMDALLRLRSIKGTEAETLIAELEIDLRSLQRAAVREMGTFTINLDVPQERERIVGLFEEMDFATALKSYAFLSESPAMADLKANALEEGRNSALGSIFGAQHVDHEGRTVVRTSALGSGEPTEDWYTRMIAQAESLRRALVVSNSIEPVRLAIGRSVALEERHFNPIAWQSPFIPKTQAPLYALGFSRFFQGDFPSAAHLLIPQLEPSLRHVLRTRGIDPTKRRDDATEEDRSLDGIITNHRQDLQAIFGADLLEELNRIFNLQPGPNLRHEMAHGQVSAGECYTPDVIYACWLLYRVVCLPLVENWDTWVRPGLEEEE